MFVLGRDSRFVTTGRTVQFLLERGADEVFVPLEDAPGAVRPEESAGGGSLEDVLPLVDIPIVRFECSLGAMA